MDLAFDRYTLPNGLHLIVKETPHTRSVVMRGYLWGGANLDAAEQPGLAYLTVAAMRRGTQQRSFTEINDLIEGVAASVFINTGRHTVGFGGKSLAEDFDLLTDVLSDMVRHPAFPNDEIEKLRGQLLSNLKERQNSPRYIAQRNFREMLYTSEHPYGRPVSGTLKSLPTITRDQMLARYADLHPRDGLIVVVGGMDSEAIYERLAAILGDWQPEGAPPQVSVPPPPPLTEAARRAETLSNKSQVDLVLGNLGPARNSDDFYAAYIADTVLGRLGLGGRIGKRVREEEGLAYYARSGLQGGLGRAPWQMQAGVNPASLKQALELIWAELRCLRDAPISQQELDDARAYLTGVLPLQMETNEGIASTLLNIHLYDLGDDFIVRYPSIISAITPEDVQAAAQKYLDPDVYVLSLAGPDLPDEY